MNRDFPLSSLLIDNQRHNRDEHYENHYHENRIQIAALNILNQDPYCIGHACNDTRENQQGYPVSNTPLIDLLSHPHKENSSRCNRQHRYHGVQTLRQGDRVWDTVRIHGYGEGLNERDNNRSVASVTLNALPAALFFRNLFQCRKHQQEELHDDRHRNVGHDPEHEYRELREGPSGKEIQILCNGNTTRSLLGKKIHLQSIQVDPGDWYRGP